MTERVRENIHKWTIGIFSIMIPVIMGIIIWAFSQGATLAVHEKQLEHHDEEIRECKAFRNKVDDKIDDIRQDQGAMQQDLREALTILKGMKRP